MASVPWNDQVQESEKNVPEKNSLRYYTDKNRQQLFRVPENEIESFQAAAKSEGFELVELPTDQVESLLYRFYSTNDGEKQFRVPVADVDTFLESAKSEGLSIVERRKASLDEYNKFIKSGYSKLTDTQLHREIYKLESGLKTGYGELVEGGRQQILDKLTPLRQELARRDALYSSGDVVEAVAGGKSGLEADEWVRKTIEGIQIAKEKQAAFERATSGDELGPIEKLKAEHKAKYGTEASTTEVVANAIVPFAKTIGDIFRNEQYEDLVKIAKGEFDIDEELRSNSTRLGYDATLYYNGAITKDELKERLMAKARGELGERAENRAIAEASIEKRGVSTWGNIASGGLQAVGMAGEFAVPGGVAVRLAVPATAYAAGAYSDLRTERYGIGEDGSLVQEKAVDSAGMAAVKAMAFGATRVAVERFGGKLLGKAFGVTVGKGLSKIGSTKIATKIANSTLGQGVGYIVNFAKSPIKLIGWDGLPEEMGEEYLEGAINTAFGLDMTESEKGDTNPFSRLSDFTGDFFKTDNLQALAQSMLLMQAWGGGAAYLRKRYNSKQASQIILQTVDGYSEKQLNKLSLEKKCEIIAQHFKGLKKPQIESIIINGTSAVNELIKSLNAYNQVGLAKKREITSDMDAQLDAKIAEYASDENIARMIKEDITANLEDNAVFSDPEAFDEMVAVSARKFEPETMRLKVHDIRGTSMNEGQKISEIENLGVTDWQSAEQAGLTEKDRFGRYTGGAVRALNVIFHGTTKLQEGVKAGTVSGNLAENLLTAATCELGGRSAEERGELIDGILDRSNGDEALANAMIRQLEVDVDLNATVGEKLDRALTEAKAEVLKKRNPSASSDEVKGALIEPVEKPDGTITTTGEFVHGESGVNTERPMPSTPLEGVQEAPRLKGAELTFAPEGELKCQSFPEMRVKVSADGVALNNLSGVNIADPARSAEFAAVVAQVVNIAKRNGLQVIVDEVHKPIIQTLTSEIQSAGLAKTQAKLDTRSKLFSLLFKTTLGTGVTYDENSFVEALKKISTGRRLVNNHGDIYGFVDSDSVLHFNPAVMNFNTPIHEYGHLALDAIKKINPKLWEQGKKLIKDSEYYRSIVEQSNDPENPYSWAKGNDDAICDEALATMIGDRGEKLVLERGVDSKLKAWLKEVWKAFKGAFGLADLSDEQIEKMTLEEFVDTINAELLSGREFGTKKKLPPTERSVKRYDEAEGSGSNGLYRFRNDRGYLFAIPVDMERTHPGGKVVFATDDANITDWIQSALNGYDLRMSKSGKLYVKGRNGLPDELALIFGRFPTIGGNDGLGLELANSTGIASYNLMTPDQLVASLKSDRANYDAWAKAKSEGKSLEEARQEEHYADEAAREEAERKARWENSGMGILDYIRSRMEDGDPEFDLDWEIAREMANDRAKARFSIGGFHGALATGKVGLLREADKMEKGGASREEIWRTTGWWRGKDGKWRVELPDIKMRSKREIEAAVKLYGNSISLGELVVAPELFKAYPALEETRIILDNDYFSSLTRGSFDPSTKDITLNGKGQISLANMPFVDRDAYDTAKQKASSDDFLKNWIELSKELGIEVGTFDEEREKAKAKIGEIEKRIVEKNRERLQSLDSDETRSILAHEIQHWIQENEGFAKGGNVKTIREARALNKSLMRDLRKALNKYGFEEWADKFTESDGFVDKVKAARLKWPGRQFLMEHLFAESLGDEARTNVLQLLDKAEAIYNENAKEAHYGYTESEAYRSLLGEIEARNVQRRLDMSPEERAATPPWETESVPENRQIVRFSARPAMSALAKVKVGESVEGVTADSLRNAIKTKIENGIQDGEFRFKKPEDKSRLVSEAVRFYKRFSQKIVMLSDGRCVYFVPDARAKAERGLTNDEAWAEYAIHAVTSSGQKIPGKSWNERLYNKTKAANIWRIENILKAERCKVQEDSRDGRFGIEFYGRGIDGKTIRIVTRPDESGNIYTDLTEVTILGSGKERNLPPRKPLAEVVGAAQYRGGLLTDDNESLPQNAASAQARFQYVRGVDWSDITMDIFKFVPAGTLTAMGETEQSAAGLAGAIEKRGALRPWTKADSPADRAKPIAFDAADMVMFWRAVSGSLRNPHVQKGERIKGRPSAIGLNIGGDRIEIVSKLFGVIDESDIKKLHEDCRSEGYFRNENTDWCAANDKGAIEDERLRSQAELDRRTRELYKTRVETGEGGEHYATQVLGHEIGHTLGLLPTGAKLGEVGDATRTLYEAFESELRRQTGGLRVMRGEDNLSKEIGKLIAWWHGTETMPEYYAKPKEKFAELFGIFLTQPESVQAQAPKAYDLCVKLIAGNEKLTKAYQTITALKWDGKSNDAVMAEVRKTWDKEAQDQYRELVKLTKESISLKRDEFNYALNDRFGPMFAISTRALKAEKKILDEAVRTGAMSEAEAADRYKAKQNEIDALKTSLYDWQRQTGGQTRLMIAQFDDVKAQAEKDGVNWNDVRTYAHNMRVIELGGRATAHGVDPARASAILDEMRQKLGDEKYLKVEKTWKAYRAVYEKSVLNDPNVRELFDADTMKMLEANKHYVTMRHRMGAEETAEWLEKIKAYKDGNSNAWDPCIDIQERMNRGLGSTAGESSTFVLYHLVGSFEATEDPLAATIRRAIEIKESAARNHLLKQTSETLRTLGAKGVFDKVAGSKATKVDPNVYGKLFYMDGGVKHELIVPKVIYKSFKAESQNALPGFGAAMRAIRNTMTLWNPMFVNRAYLIDKSGLEANIKGLHKAPIDILSEALCFRGIGVPLYMINNYLARFTPICNTWIGKLLWNENTANHYAHKAQKIARIVYEGRFAERLEEARQLRALGETGRATEIEENIAIAQEMMRRNIFQSAYSFNKQQAGFDTDEIMRQFGYRIDGGKDPKSWKSRARNLGRWWTRFGEEQESVTKIIAYLYELKKGTSAEEASRIAIERGGTPNLAARGVAASYIENATGFFWNVRKEATLRTFRAIKDHPTEWITKNFAQTAMPALLKCLIITGGLEMIIRAMFDDDEEKIQNSWWAGEVVNYARFMNSAMKCVPGYYQRNYNIIPIAKFGDEVLSMRIKYSPEEFAIQNAVHTAFQKFGADPTDPDADWSSFNREMLSQITPDIFGGNYALDLAQILIGPIIGYNPYDRYRQRNVYDNSTWEARWSAPGNMTTKMVTNFANYSPFGSFVTRFKDGQEQKIEDSDVPAWLDAVLQTPLLSRIPASMLSITSSDSYLKALANVDSKQKAYARIVAGDLLAKCIENGRLGGFEEGLKDLPPELKRLAIRHVLNGWRQFHMDPNAKKLRAMRRIKDPNLKRKARKWIEDAEKYGD